MRAVRGWRGLDTTECPRCSFSSFSSSPLSSSSLCKALRFFRTVAFR